MQLARKAKKNRTNINRFNLPRKTSIRRKFDLSSSTYNSRSFSNPIPSLMCHNNQPFTSDGDIPNTFNFYFTSIFTQNSNFAMKQMPNFEATIFIADLIHLFLLLNPCLRNAMTPTQWVPTNFLSLLFTVHLGYWLHLFVNRLCISRLSKSGLIPGKFLRISPLHKCGSRSHVENYRPICKTSKFLLILEIIMFKLIENELVN